ncbi:DUF2997 domain-containing protein [Thermostichus vulcanus]|uniref:DUF2997 domain-containing protein n=1 Tax=Thermostichus vulcanus str. 'Rupite' TaxID=2813851 RepID=A0ABT0CE52_THEVL|nr:DUF2997 domain-containing protein [Thermostichus vulcanus]MCJ2544048.1 DUF2997 domain-containing protein [Thermostichus vulcanus str. 'Rupite']
MSEYVKVEYRIDQNGQITETVLNGSGPSCTLTTAELESALGSVEKRELLPEYHQLFPAEAEAEVSLKQSH